MKILNYEVENFRPFSDPVRLDGLGQLNLIVGPNNVGKSALLMPLRRLTRIDWQFVPNEPMPDGIGTMASGSAEFREADFRANEGSIRIVCQIEGFVDAGEQAALLEWGASYPSESFGGDGELTTSIDFGWAEQGEESYACLPNSTSAAHHLADQIVYVPAERKIRNDFYEPDRRSDEERLYSGRSLYGDLLEYFLPDPEDGTRPEDYDDLGRLEAFLEGVFGTSACIWPTPDEDVLLALGDEPGRPLNDLGAGVRQIVVIATALAMVDDPILLLEEPEISLHPQLQRRLLSQLADTEVQCFITTHSNHLLDFHDPEICAYRLWAEDDGTRRVERSGPDDLQFLHDLGVRPGSLNTANAMIWVEGPSDAIYIEHWLSRHETGQDFERGIEYTFGFTGGGMLKEYGIDRDENLAGFFDNHPSIFLVADRDPTEDKEPGKKYFQELVQEEGFPEDRLWITDAKEIEGYVADCVLQATKDYHAVDANSANAVRSKEFESLSDRLDSLDDAPTSFGKTELARRAVEQFEELDGDIVLAVGDLRARLDDLVEFIEKCQRAIPTP